MRNLFGSDFPDPTCGSFHVYFFGAPDLVVAFGSARIVDVDLLRKFFN